MNDRWRGERMNTDWGQPWGPKQREDEPLAIRSLQVLKSRNESPNVLPSLISYPGPSWVRSNSFLESFLALAVTLHWGLKLSAANSLESCYADVPCICIFPSLQMHSHFCLLFILLLRSKGQRPLNKLISHLLQAQSGLSRKCNIELPNKPELTNHQFCCVFWV